MIQVDPIQVFICGNDRQGVFENIFEVPAK